VYVSGVSLLFASAPYGWFGLGLLLAGAAMGAQLLQSTPKEWKLFRVSLGPREHWFELLCVAAIIALSYMMFSDHFGGHAPSNHDHPVHMVKAARLYKMLAGGQLWGWSQDWYAGYPAQYLYPFGADLWVVFVYVCGMGFLSFSAAYAIAFAIFWALQGWTIYWFGKRLFDRWVGLVAALLFLTDAGSYRLGGWSFTADWGVWPQAFSTSLGLLALLHLPAVLQRKGWRPVAWFGLFLGLALWTHPMQMLHFGVVFPVALLAYCLTTSQPVLPALGRLSFGYALGLGIGSLWWLPFVSSRSFATAYGVPWWTAKKVGHAMYTLGLVPGTWYLLVALGLAGTLGLLLSRRLFAFFSGLMLLVLLVTGTSTFLNVFHLYDLLPALKHVQFQRFSILLKPYLFVAAAYVVVLAVTSLVSSLQLAPGDDTPEEGEGTAPSDKGEGVPLATLAPQWSVFAPGNATLALRMVLVGTLLAPVAGPFAQRYYDAHIGKRLSPAKHHRYNRNKQQFVKWASTVFPKEKKKGWFRLGLFVGTHEHSFFDLGTALDVPVYKVGFTPASIYKYKIEKSGVTLLKHLNVKYILATYYLYGSEYKQIKTFGSLRVYRFMGWKPEPFRVVKGRGKVRLVSFARERIVLKAEAGAKGLLQLNVSHFSRWKATHNGRSIPIQVRPVPGYPKSTGMMAVALRPGEYRFVFRRGIAEWAAGTCALICLVLIGWLVWVDRRSPEQLASSRLVRVTEALAVWETRHRTGMVLAGWSGVVLVTVGVVLFARWVPPSERNKLSYKHNIRRSTYDFATRLSQARVSVGYGKGRVCKWSGRAFRCGRQGWQHVQSVVREFERNTRKRCIWTHPQSSGPLTLSFSNAVLGDVIWGYYGVARSGVEHPHRPVRLRVEVNGRMLYNEVTKGDATTHPLRVDLPKALRHRVARVRFLISARNVGRRHFCFYAVSGVSPEAAGKPGTPKKTLRIWPAPRRKKKVQLRLLPSAPRLRIRLAPRSRPAPRPGARPTSKPVWRPASRPALRPALRPVPVRPASRPVSRPVLRPAKR
jgi:hypothetical protein